MIRNKRRIIIKRQSVNKIYNQKSFLLIKDQNRLKIKYFLTFLNNSIA